MTNCETVVDFCGPDYIEYNQLWDVDGDEMFNNHINHFN